MHQKGQQQHTSILWQMFVIGKMWRELDDKSKYEEMNLKDKERYKKEMEEYEASK